MGHLHRFWYAYHRNDQHHCKEGSKWLDGARNYRRTTQGSFSKLVHHLTRQPQRGCAYSPSKQLADMFYIV